jgi:hypothetical protein
MYLFHVPDLDVETTAQPSEFLTGFLK